MCKGKQTNIRKLGANTSFGILELIHTKICGPFSATSLNGQQYFIMLIDDFSSYGYIYLIHEKSESLDIFKAFKVEVKNQLNKKIKSDKYDRGIEYYGKYDRSGEQCPRPFKKFLEEYGIVPECTTLGKLSMDGVVEKCNKTLKDM